jgi:diaminohydroxyphosphoribosylaminopyrimidine deaminase / 5-amino-6-(5-phosphoribosylamino)uracil reductase
MVFNMSVGEKYTDEYYMKEAIELAKKGIGKVNPNPLVGAVIVKNNEIIGSGYHQTYGEAHAEINAITDAESKGISVEGATIYVTLEPCSHYGKTPPCALKIVDKKFKRVVVGSNDPNPLVSGRGLEMIRNAGIEVITGILETECTEINKVFYKYITTKIPYIFLKVAITLDGKIATSTGDSKWISNEESRGKVQYYRNKFMGIMIGANTLNNDNPSLTARMSEGRDPYRIIIDPDLISNDSFNVVKNNKDSKTIIVTRETNKNEKAYELETKYNVKFIFIENSDKEFDIKNIVEKIGELGIDSILIEGGSRVISKAFEEDIIDAGEIFVSNKILGDEKGISFISGFTKLKMQEAMELPNVKFNIYGNNIGIEWRK